MTRTPPSRTTLEDVLKAIDDAGDIKPHRKQDMRSAVRVVAKAIGREPGQIMADPRGLGNALNRVSHLSIGLSAGRWANCRSWLRAALKLVVPVMPGAHKQPLLKEWERLATEVRKTRSCWLRLGRLMRWLSARQIGPSSVTLDDLERYREEYLSDALLGNAELSWKATRQSWERMRKACQDWPQIELVTPPNPQHFGLPWTAFPKSLKTEVDRLLERYAGQDLGEDGPPRPLRPATLKLRDHELRIHASALIHMGIAVETLTSLSICLSLENYKLGLRWLHNHYGGKPNRTIHNTAANLKSIAKHWLKADNTTLESMKRIVRNLAPVEQAASDKNRERLRPFQSEDVVRKLVDLPRSIRRKVETSKSANARKKGLSTAALAIEILLIAPLRMANLAALHLDRHFRKVGNQLHLVIPKEEVKNSVELEFILPSETVEMIDWFVANHRKADPRNRYLFAGEGLDHKCHSTMAVQIAGTVKSFLGLSVHPHLFRHIAATIFLKANPGQYEPVRLVLGHQRIETTTAAYAAQEETSARVHFAKTVLNLRRQSTEMQHQATLAARNRKRKVSANLTARRSSKSTACPIPQPQPSHKRET